MNQAMALYIGFALGANCIFLSSSFSNGLELASFSFHFNSFKEGCPSARAVLQGGLPLKNFNYNKYVTSKI